jgi:hypothetical protein
MWHTTIFLSATLMLAACASTPVATKQAPQPLTARIGSNQDDTPETRMAAAKRYYVTVDIKKLMDRSLRASVANLPEDKRDEVLALAKAHLHVDDLAAITLAALVKNFTTDELNAMANFYGSAEGQSILDKYPTYLAEVMPAILAEVRRVFALVPLAPELYPPRDPIEPSTLVWTAIFCGLAMATLALHHIRGRDRG